MWWTLLLRLALVYRVALALGLHCPDELAIAIARAAPLDEDAALLVVWAAAESGLQQNPRPWSQDARDGLSNGYLQLRGEAGILGAEGQVRAWLDLRGRYAALCGDDGLRGIASGRCDRGGALVARRLALAHRLLGAECDDTRPPSPLSLVVKAGGS